MLEIEPLHRSTQYCFSVKDRHHCIAPTVLSIVEITALLVCVCVCVCVYMCVYADR